MGCLQPLHGCRTAILGITVLISPDVSMAVGVVSDTVHDPECLFPVDPLHGHKLPADLHHGGLFGFRRTATVDVVDPDTLLQCVLRAGSRGHDWTSKYLSASRWASSAARSIDHGELFPTMEWNSLRTSADSRTCRACPSRSIKGRSPSRSMVSANWRMRSANRCTLRRNSRSK